MLPLSTVDKPGFRAMISRLNPRCDLPTRSYCSRIAIPALYQEVREGLQSSLRSIDIDHFSGTTDLWSSSAMEPYLSYTIHYVTSSWELTSHCLQAHYMPEDHTGINLQDALSQTLLNWELDATKLVALTTDSGSNIVLACDLLHWRRLSCFGHNLDLAIQKVLQMDGLNEYCVCADKLFLQFYAIGKGGESLLKSKTNEIYPSIN